MKPQSLCRGTEVPEGAERHLVALQKFLSRFQGERRKKSISGIESEPPGGPEKPHLPA